MKSTPCGRLTSCLLTNQNRSRRRAVGALTLASASSLLPGGGSGVSQYSSKRRVVNGFVGQAATPEDTRRQQHHESSIAAPRLLLARGIQQVRGKKTKSSVRFEDLPQGPLLVPPAAAAAAPSPPSSSSSSSSSTPSPDSEPAGKGKGKGKKRKKKEKGEEHEVEVQDEGGGRIGGGEEEEGPAYPTVVLQARRNMRKFDNCVLLTRVGGFYELYFEHAEEYGPLLNLKVAQKKTSAGPVPMAGFPFFQLERFLKTLVLDLNCYVAVAEEFPNDPGDRVKSGGLMHDRRVTRIITPGTLIDENFIDPYANNYVMAIHLNNLEQEAAVTTVVTDHIPGVSAESVPTDAPIGLAWLDISTGQFYTQSTTTSSLSSILSRVAPREIVIDEVFQSQKDHNLFSVLAEDRHLITFTPQGEHLPLSEWAPMLESEIPPHVAPSFTPDEVAAGSLLLQYVRNRLLGISMRLQPPLRHENLSVMTIDKTSMRSLEIKQTMRDGTFRGSLLHTIRSTVTKGGARLLNAWLSAPSTSLETIRARQDLVEAFIGNDDLRDEIVMLLRRCHDSQRLVQKFAFGRGDADDMIALANTIRATQEIVALLERYSAQQEQARSDGTAGGAKCVESLLSRITLDEPTKLANRIWKSIDEEGLVQQHRDEDSEASELVALAEDVVAAEEGGDATTNSSNTKAAAAASSKKRRPTSIRDHYYAAAADDSNVAFVMKPEASRGLRSLHAELAGLLQEKADLGETLRERYGTPSLTLKWTPNLGHIAHVKGKDAQRIMAFTSAGTATKTRKKKKKGEEATQAEEEEGEEAEEEDGGGDEDNKNNTNDTATTVSASRSTRALHLPAWTRLGQRIHRARFEIAAEERRLFAELRAAVVRNLVKLRRNAAALDELDVLAASFARLAASGGGGSGSGSGGSFVRPTLDDSTAHEIIGGRHPTVEAGLRERGRTFTKNDCLVGSSSSSSSSNANPGSGKLWLITGPNMAGKSTYLRQTALLTILAQAGSWVPADHARLGVVDAIYSRVGSAAGDSLHQDQSTFMVEMLEAAQILRRATPRSLVVMDEVGRGTTPRDGAAVAFAALHHLAAVNRCRALFATHFHVLADWARERGMLVAGAAAAAAAAGGGSSGGQGGGGGGQVDTYCTDIEEDGAGGFVYVHKLRRGVNRRSHALKVARLAGLPEAAIAIAREVIGDEEGVEGGGEEENEKGSRDRHMKNDYDELD